MGITGIVAGLLVLALGGKIGLAELPDGYGTVLGPEFEGGKELSASGSGSPWPSRAVTTG